MFTLFFAFGAFFHALVASIASVVLTFFKVFRPNIFVHNFTEVFIYGGLAAIFVPIGGFTVFYAIIILVLISIYDMYAVWKSKHMVKLANFTAESKLFAGLNIPYEKNSGKIEKISARPLVKKGTSKGKEIKSAILGGGDIGFPLLFSGAVLKEIIVLNNSIPLIILKAFVVPVFTTIALYILFVKGEKNKFYPAMPFLTAGCLIGYGALVLINFWI
jgi:presenilin-like A22 family membrane protease